MQIVKIRGETPTGAPVAGAPRAGSLLRACSERGGKVGNHAVAERPPADSEEREPISMSSRSFATKRSRARDGMLTVAATDTEIGLELGVSEVDVKEDGEARIPADKMNQIVRASNDDTLNIHVKGTEVHITGKDSKFKVFGYNPSEFPGVHAFDEDSIAFESDTTTMRRLIGRTVFATAVENSRYAINGVLIERKGRHLRLLATDGRRLAVAKGECATAADGDANLIVPTKALNVLSPSSGEGRLRPDVHPPPGSGADPAESVLRRTRLHGSDPGRSGGRSRKSGSSPVRNARTRGRRGPSIRASARGRGCRPPHFHSGPPGNRRRRGPRARAGVPGLRHRPGRPG